MFWAQLCVCVCVYAHMRVKEKMGESQEIPLGNQELGYLWTLRIEIIFFLKVVSTVLIFFSATDVLLCLHSFQSSYFCKLILDFSPLYR